MTKLKLYKLLIGVIKAIKRYLNGDWIGYLHFVVELTAEWWSFTYSYLIDAFICPKVRTFGREKMGHD